MNNIDEENFRNGSLVYSYTKSFLFNHELQCIRLETHAIEKLKSDWERR